MSVTVDPRRVTVVPIVPHPALKHARVRPCPPPPAPWYPLYAYPSPTFNVRRNCAFTAADAAPPVPPSPYEVLGSPAAAAAAAPPVVVVAAARCAAMAADSSAVCCRCRRSSSSIFRRNRSNSFCGVSPAGEAHQAGGAFPRLPLDAQPRRPNPVPNTMRYHVPAAGHPPEGLHPCSALQGRTRKTSHGGRVFRGALAPTRRVCASPPHHATDEALCRGRSRSPHIPRPRLRRRRIGPTRLRSGRSRVRTLRRCRAISSSLRSLALCGRQPSGGAQHRVGVGVGGVGGGWGGRVKWGREAPHT
jgi:hypothetical protein